MAAVKKFNSNLLIQSTGLSANITLDAETLFVDAADHAGAEQIVDQACKKLLCNEIMEYYTFTVVEA